MDAITLTATVDEDHHLEVTLPSAFPSGPVELVIRPLIQNDEAEPVLTREGARAKLAAAGVLGVGPYAEPGAEPLSKEERHALGQLFVSTQSIADLIDEDRGPR